MKLSEYVTKTGNTAIIKTVKRYAQSDLRIAEKKGAVMITQSVSGLLDVSFTDGVYLIYHSEVDLVETRKQGKPIVNETIFYNGNDKKQAIAALMELYDIMF